MMNSGCLQGSSNIGLEKCLWESKLQRPQLLRGQKRVLLTFRGLKVCPGKALLEGGAGRSLRNGAGDGAPQLMEATAQEGYY